MTTEPAATEGRRLSLLVVEDEGVLAYLLEGVLGSIGHRILGPASSAEEAIRLARQEAPDLALVDVMLRQGLSGIELARELKRSGIPVLFLTGHPEKVQDLAELALGYIAKPYSPTMVGQSVEAVRQVLDGHRPQHLPFGLHLFEGSSEAAPPTL